MSDYADLCNETADELEAAHDRIELQAARIATLTEALRGLVEAAERAGRLVRHDVLPAGLLSAAAKAKEALNGD